MCVLSARVAFGAYAETGVFAVSARKPVESPLPRHREAGDYHIDELDLS
jgi:hypothetical protein